MFIHPTETISRLGTTSPEDVKKYGNFRFFGKVIEDRGYQYMVRCKYRYPNMSSTARLKLNVPKDDYFVLKVFNYD